VAVDECGVSGEWSLEHRRDRLPPLRLTETGAILMVDGSSNGTIFSQSDDADDQRVWHFRKPGDNASDRWDPTPLTYACETIIHDQRRQMSRIHLVFPYPRIPGGVNEVVEYAQSLASDYGLNVNCVTKDGMITVTFERIEGEK
jgi:hypothetical protein